MDEESAVDISKYEQVPLTAFVIPGYEKLIKRIMVLHGSTLPSGELFLVETIGDIAKLLPEQFAKLPAVGGVYVNSLIALQKELPFFLNITKPIAPVPQIDLSTAQLETPLHQLSLSPQYQKLIKRISNTIGTVNTVQDMLSITPVSFGRLPAVGKLYVELLTTFQQELLCAEGYQQTMNGVNEDLPSLITLSPDQLEMPIERIAFPTQYAKLIKKIALVASHVVTVQDLLNLEPEIFAKLTTVGKLYVQNLIALQSELPTLLAAQANKFSSLNLMEFNEIDNALIEDVETYLWILDEAKQDIALSRWGFNHEHKSLEEVGITHGLTKERIRQLEKPINHNLPRALRISPKVLWATIREKMTEDLTVLLPNLAKCFATDKLFYAFIELCCQVEDGSIRKIVFAKINLKTINLLFCNSPSPIDKETIINELTSNYGYSRASAIQGMQQLANLNRIAITEQGIYPKKLSRTEAVAHVLSSHPDGLPWKDVVRIANAQGYTSKPLDESRQGATVFSDAEYVYLSDRGTYRNLLFLDLEQFDIPKIMRHLLDYFDQNKISALHLHDYYYQTKSQRDQIEYFTLRHLVREYGEEYGLYFDGKSGSDSVSLDPDSKRITQADVIIKVLNESKFAMTMQEIAERLKSKSTCHANFYISNLMEEGKVVRVDKLVYTIPEKAFRDIDTDAVMQVIREIINVPNTIVEADVFREYVNMELNLSYSKYIYAALANTHLKEFGWHRHNTLFSKNPIPYKNLLDASRQLCDLSLSNKENAEILKKAIWLTDAVVSPLVHQWRIHLKIAE